MSDDEERKEFEAWYARTAFDYVLSPIGSRDCSLQWRAWQQAHARGIVAGMRRAAEIVGHPDNTFRICTLVAPDIIAVADKLEQEQP